MSRKWGYGLLLLAALAVGPWACGPPDLVPNQPPSSGPHPWRVWWLDDRVMGREPTDRAELADLGPELDSLMRAYLAEHARDPWRLSRGLAFFHHLPSRPPLRDLAVTHLAHENGGVRVSAALAVGSVGAEPDLVPLMPLLDDVYSSAAFKVSEALARHGEPRTVPALNAWLRMVDDRERGDGDLIQKVVDARDALAERLKDAPAVDAEWGRHAAAAASDDPKARAAAAGSLAGLGGDGDSNLFPVVPLLEDEDAAVRAAAAEALGKAGGRRTLAALDVWLRVAGDRDGLDPARVEQVRAARTTLADRLKGTPPGK